MRQSIYGFIANSKTVAFADIFLVITCSSRWKVIRDALLRGQKVIDRANIPARIFCIKPRAMMSYNSNEEVSGEVEAHLYAIEF